MTPKQLKSARKKLGLSARGLARELGMTGMWDDRSVRRWESGQHPVPEDVATKVKGMLECLKP